MTIYAGMDVSDKATHICVVDAEGVVIRRDVDHGETLLNPQTVTMHPV